MQKNVKISDIGEKRLVNEITSCLDVHEDLLYGFGHDSAFLNVKVESDEVLLLNTDRSGMNIAYKLGLYDGRCIGDFAVSHAISDIFASGGKPYCITLAMLLPPDMSLSLVKEIMQGAQDAAKKYGAFIASGDTKHNPKFAMVVTALGKAKKDEILTRSNAKAGDLIVAAGNFGLMLSGLTAFKKNLEISESQKEIFTRSLVYQNPPYNFAREVASRRLAHACMDNSDGIISSMRSLSQSSGLGAILNKDSIPISKEVLDIANKLNIDPFGLCLGSGDWQYVYALAPENIDAFYDIGKSTHTNVTVIG